MRDPGGLTQVPTGELLKFHPLLPLVLKVISCSIFVRPALLYVDQLHRGTAMGGIFHSRPRAGPPFRVSRDLEVFQIVMHLELSPLELQTTLQGDLRSHSCESYIRATHTSPHIPHPQDIGSPPTEVPSFSPP